MGKVSQEMESKILELGRKGLLRRQICLQLGISSKPVRRLLDPEAHKNYEESRRRRSINVFRVRSGGIDRYMRVDGRRHRPERCELCNQLPPKKLLSWHHWNDEAPWKGLWLCLHCHIFAEQVDKGIDQQRYLELKAIHDQDELGERKPVLPDSPKPGDPTCPHCGTKLYKAGWSHHGNRKQRYHCNKCRKITAHPIWLK